MENKKKYEKSESQILYVYGASLINAGMGQWLKTWDDLLHIVDDKETELFRDYFSSESFNTFFLDKFLASRLDAVTYAGWNDAELDRKKFRTDPKLDQSLKEYYELCFKGAIIKNDLKT